jgi:maltose alpha-D-glucosyltransferase/alpha-amylase
MTKRVTPQRARPDDPLWYKDAIIYELHVRAFSDGDDDGFGDFRGLAQKLDYLQDLGVNVLWLLPFFPSPLKDDGYDIADYIGIHPVYGQLRDFKKFIREAHHRGLKVITELVLNHTSDQHPWFQRARRAKPGSPWRDFYVWSDTPDRYREARIIFQDFESSNWAWDPVAQAYYWHRFYSHQPDLNYDSPQVLKAVFRVVDFWLKLGVDGLRLDAVPYLFQREGTNCENLPETHAFLKKLRAYVDRHFDNRMLLAEANQWPEEAAAYFGDGDECHVAFHFPIMPRLFIAIRLEDRFPIIDVLEQTPSIPVNCQWALFLRNHDELTLEMVTDEERDYMYRMYADDPQMRINLGIRRRLAPLLLNHRRKIELMTSLLFSLPGTPVIYYGDEIGMGNNIYLGDRNGVRTPMQWNSDRNAGFSKANAQRLFLPVIIDPEYHYESVNVEAQQQNPSSLLHWTRRFITLRRKYRAFGRGSIEFLQPENRKILVFVRRYEEECILVVANLSRYVQYAEIDLSPWKGRIPVEMLGRTAFPGIQDSPYFLTLGPHNFFWFTLEPASEGERTPAAREIPPAPFLGPVGKGEEIFQEELRPALERILRNYCRKARWFRGKARGIRSVTLFEVIPVTHSPRRSWITFIAVDFFEGDPEIYQLPLSVAGEEQAEGLFKEHPAAVIAQLLGRDGRPAGLLFDAAVSPDFCASLLTVMMRSRQVKGRKGELLGSRTKNHRAQWPKGDVPLSPSVIRAEQSNTSVVFGERFIMKLYRKIEDGINPDLEVGRFLTEARFPNTPPVAGALEYRKNKTATLTLGILQKFVRNEGDAWEYTLDFLSQYFEQTLAQVPETRGFPEPTGHFLDWLGKDLPPKVSEAVGPYLESARMLGRRTGDLHQALASASGNPDFEPEPFTTLYQRSLYQSMRNLGNQVFHLLRKKIKELPDRLSQDVGSLLALEKEIFSRFRFLLERKIGAFRIRCHGDFHLGQVLYTGNDFVIMDFEGEPARSLGERRLKRSPLRDIAGMLRSFHYAAYAALFHLEDRGLTRREDFLLVETMARYWQFWVSVAFLQAYQDRIAAVPLLVRPLEEFRIMLDAYLLEKAIYELGYEINNRPDWLRIPLQGIRQLIDN